MRNRRPIRDLERLLDALESELLSAGDDEIREALGPRQPSRRVIEAVWGARSAPHPLAWPRPQSLAGPDSRIH
ncbi:MAG TPA: hypothetical protein VMF62_18325 [Acetobacteraceae bacterium]|jgi:hypothetical protein|nr:hypothetical protein [Acetobacteraceae bacterium]